MMTIKVTSLPTAGGIHIALVNPQFQHYETGDNYLQADISTHVVMTFFT